VGDVAERMTRFISYAKIDSLLALFLSKDARSVRAICFSLQNSGEGKGACNFFFILFQTKIEQEARPPLKWRDPGETSTTAVLYLPSTAPSYCYDGEIQANQTSTTAVLYLPSTAPSHCYDGEIQANIDNSSSIPAFHCNKPLLPGQNIDNSSSIPAFHC
jgi:hypothetical protein